MKIVCIFHQESNGNHDFVLNPKIHRPCFTCQNRQQGLSSLPVTIFGPSPLAKNLVTLSTRFLDMHLKKPWCKGGHIGCCLGEGQTYVRPGSIQLYAWFCPGFGSGRPKGPEDVPRAPQDLHWEATDHRPNYLPACLPVYLATWLPGYLPTCLPAYLLDICIPTYLLALLATKLATKLPTKLPIHHPSTQTYLVRPTKIPANLPSHPHSYLLPEIKQW